MTTVVIADTTSGIRPAIEEIFNAYGGIEKVIPVNTGKVFLKPNAIHFAPYNYTEPIVLDALLAYLRDHGYKRLAVMEGCTGGNFTRLVYKVIGYTDICKHYGAEPVYLDEGPTVQVDLNDGTKTRVSKRLYNEIINRGNNFYLDFPKLKTHSMAKLTLGVKNQQAFPVAGDRMAQHSHATLHKRLAALYALTRPDFCIIEGLKATSHGHAPTTALLSESLVDMNILIGGKDTLAVDVVGGRVLGYKLEEVEHLRLCAEQGLGEADLDHIEIKGVPITRFTEKIPYTLLRRVNPDVHIVTGRNRACVEGCKGNSDAIQEMLYNDFQGKGGWTLVYGSGFEDADLDNLPGDMLIVGPCACKEAGEKLAAKYPRRTIHRIDQHNDLMSNTRLQAKMMGVVPVKMVPGNPLSAAFTLLQAKLHGLNARVPPLLG